MKARIPGAAGGGQQNMMKQIQKMQEDMAQKQEELELREYSASVGGGAVEITVDGNHQVKSIILKPEIVDPEDLEMLQDLLIGAINEAMRKVDDTSESEMSKLTGGMNLPGLF